MRFLQRRIKPIIVAVVVFVSVGTWAHLNDFHFPPATETIYLLAHGQGKPAYLSDAYFETDGSFFVAIRHGWPRPSWWKYDANLTPSVSFSRKNGQSVDWCCYSGTDGHYYFDKRSQAWGMFGKFDQPASVGTSPLIVDVKMDTPEKPSEFTGTATFSTKP